MFEDTKPIWRQAHATSAGPRTIDLSNDRSADELSQHRKETAPSESKESRADVPKELEGTQPSIATSSTHPPGSAE